MLLNLKIEETILELSIFKGLVVHCGYLLQQGYKIFDSLIFVMLYQVSCSAVHYNHFERPKTFATRFRYPYLDKQLLRSQFLKVLCTIVTALLHQEFCLEHQKISPVLIAFSRPSQMLKIYI